MAVAAPVALVRGMGAPLLAGHGVGGSGVRVGPWQDLLLLQRLLLPLMLPQVCDQAGVARQFGQARHRAAAELALSIAMVFHRFLRRTNVLLPLLLLLFPLYHLWRDLRLHHPQSVPLVWRWHWEEMSERKTGEGMAGKCDVKCSVYVQSSRCNGLQLSPGVPVGVTEMS